MKWLKKFKNNKSQLTQEKEMSLDELMDDILADDDEIEFTEKTEARTSSPVIFYDSELSDKAIAEKADPRAGFLYEKGKQNKVVAEEQKDEVKINKIVFHKQFKQYLSQLEVPVETVKNLLHEFIAALNLQEVTTEEVSSFLSSMAEDKHRKILKRKLEQEYNALLEAVYINFLHIPEEKDEDLYLVFSECFFIELTLLEFQLGE